MSDELYFGFYKEIHGINLSQKKCFVYILDREYLINVHGEIGIRAIGSRIIFDVVSGSSSRKDSGSRRHITRFDSRRCVVAQIYNSSIIHHHKMPWHEPIRSY